MSRDIWPTPFFEKMTIRRAGRHGKNTRIKVRAKIIFNAKCLTKMEKGDRCHLFHVTLLDGIEKCTVKIVAHEDTTIGLFGAKVFAQAKGKLVEQDEDVHMLLIEVGNVAYEHNVTLGDATEISGSCDIIITVFRKKKTVNNPKVTYTEVRTGKGVTFVMNSSDVVMNGGKICQNDHSTTVHHINY